MNSETSKTYLSHLLATTLSDLKLTPHLENINIATPEPQFGDYSTNMALIIAKKAKVNPAELAEKITAELQKRDGEKVFGEIYQVNGFINFKLSQKFLLQNLQKIAEEREEFGGLDLGQGEKILVEYFQPNMAKPLHLGHLRTAVIGDALFRIFQFAGFRPESDTHLGDWGTQFGLLLYAYKKYGNQEAVAKDPIRELNKLYVRVNSEMESSPELKELGKAEFVRLEKGDPENRALWQRFRDWSWQEYEIVYSKLGIRRADHDWPESFYEDKMPAVVKELKDKGLLVESQGARIVNLEQFNLGIAVVIKSDGGTTYLLRDLAAYIFRQSQGFARQYYVIDIRQKHQMAQAFKILELMGYIKHPGQAVHISYGFLTLPEGAMSTRKGTVVGAEEFIQDVEARALEIIQEKNPGLPNKAEVARQVASGAIKYFDLSHNIKSDIVFDPKKAISFEGNTGPYLQYTHARIHGILRKANVKFQISNLKSISNDKIFNDYELNVLRKLNQFPEVVERVATDYAPNYLSQYLFELSQTFNSFYQEVPVLQEEDELLRLFRLQLITATAQVIKNGLYLLGIEAPEEM